MKRYNRRFIWEKEDIIIIKKIKIDEAVDIINAELKKKGK